MKPREIEIPILTAGDYGEAGRWSLATLKRVVDGYERAGEKVPLVLGHPKHDDPAHGWVNSLRVSGKRLLAKVGELSDEVTELVRQGSYRKISAAFYPEKDGIGPNLKHVGLLGAAAPRDRSLPVVSFMSDEKYGDWVSFADATPARLDGEGWPILRMLDALIARWASPPESETEAAVEAEAEAVKSSGAEGEAIDRFVDKAVSDGKLPPAFRQRGGREFLRAIAEVGGSVAFSEEGEEGAGSPNENPVRWFMDVVETFPAFFSETAPEPQPGGVETGDERLYRRAFDRLDGRQDLQGRGVTMEIFRRVYTPEDCRNILHHR